MNKDYNKGMADYKHHLKLDVQATGLLNRMPYPRGVGYLEGKIAWAESMIQLDSSSRAYWLGYLRLLKPELRYARRLY